MARLIDADALEDDVMERYCKDCEKRKGMKRGKWRVIYEIGEAPCRACDVDDMKTELEEAPTIDADPIRHGHWILTNKPNIYGGTTVQCSECGYEGVIAHIEDHHYCWVCGARMDEEGTP